MVGGVVKFARPFLRETPGVFMNEMAKEPNWVGGKKRMKSFLISAKMLTFADWKALPRSAAGPAPCMNSYAYGEGREESPGSRGRSTSENRSSWRQLDMGEENDRPASPGKGEKVV